MRIGTKILVWIGPLVLLGAFSNLARADSIALRDGRHIRGRFAGGTEGVIAFSVDGVTQYYNVRDIMVMTFEQDDYSGEPQDLKPNPSRYMRPEKQGSGTRPSPVLKPAAMRR
jgi:hypothetical protein